MAHLKPNHYKEICHKDYTGSPSIDSMMREVMHMLGNIDFEHEFELDRLEKSGTDQELKAYIKGKIRVAYEERREPYVELLASLRQRRQRLSFPQ